MLKRKEFILGAACGLLVAAGATAGGVISWPGAYAETRPGQIVASAGASGLAFAPPQGAPLSFADIVQQVAPAVVQIEVETPVERPQGMQGFQIPGMPGFVIPGPQGQPANPDAEPELAQGAGSGFFISADGFIVTNNHVVANAKSIKVKMSDGRTLDATLVGRDQGTDLAVIKVEGSDFKFVSFEESAEPRVGDWVVAVGNPFGLGGTATAGIVSAKARDIDPTGYNDYLQIDAAINRGNSGGPTFDIYGRVIGVNSAIFSPTGGSVGIGFAIPAATAKAITDQLMRGQAIQRGYIGVGIRSLSPDQWEALGESKEFKGGLVETVSPDGPAARGGVRVGDYIVSVNGEAVENGTDITRQVGRAKPNDNIRIEVVRDGRRQTLTVRSGTRPPEDELNAENEDGATPFGQPPSADGGTVVEGAGVSAITPALRERYGIPTTVEGVVVTRVTPGTGAATLGLPVGSVITRANNRAVTSAADLEAVVAAAKEAGRPGVFMLVWTPRGTVTAVLPLPKPE
ncbi:trypsin-like peptidase domain-containing protein [Brevundimonas sp.]|uniref:trypsin-like peptidase domain-containing protein n=1 Tax=Brevundimonas sp. TaxID=1871086 RepID=UPI001A339C52|nr:trypsin-like peptidase domain-containing protein [Brevundimonas sp.]MBJ7486669.1 trypsin-like peptidase domain-containing protein [Brevundimonas sp.]